MSDIVDDLRAGLPCIEGCGAPCRVMTAQSGCTCACAADEIERLRAALNGVLWMAEEWYEHGGNEDTIADDYKPALAKARAALGERT